jgi:hypothetical protein
VIVKIKIMTILESQNPLLANGGAFLKRAKIKARTEHLSPRPGAQ